MPVAVRAPASLGTGSSHAGQKSSITFGKDVARIDNKLEKDIHRMDQEASKSASLLAVSGDPRRPIQLQNSVVDPNEENSVRVSDFEISARGARDRCRAIPESSSIATTNMSIASTSASTPRDIPRRPSPWHDIAHSLSTTSLARSRSHSQSESRRRGSRASGSGLHTPIKGNLTPPTPTALVHSIPPDSGLDQYDTHKDTEILAAEFASEGEEDEDEDPISVSLKLSSSQAMKDWYSRLIQPDSDVIRHTLIARVPDQTPDTTAITSSMAISDPPAVVSGSSRYPSQPYKSATPAFDAFDIQQNVQANGLRPVNSRQTSLTKLKAEKDKEGHIEYKLKLIDPTPDRFERLVTQMMWRLKEGRNEAIYELGLADDGTVVGLTRSEMDASLSTLEMMASEVGATVIVLKEIVLAGSRHSPQLIPAKAAPLKPRLRSSVSSLATTGSANTSTSSIPNSFDDSTYQTRQRTKSRTKHQQKFLRRRHYQEKQYRPPTSAMEGEHDDVAHEAKIGQGSRERRLVFDPEDLRLGEEGMSSDEEWLKEIAFEASYDRGRRGHIRDSGNSALQADTFSRPPEDDDGPFRFDLESHEDGDSNQLSTGRPEPARPMRPYLSERAKKAAERREARRISLLRGDGKGPMWDLPPSPAIRDLRLQPSSRNLSHHPTRTSSLRLTNHSDSFDFDEAESSSQGDKVVFESGEGEDGFVVNDLMRVPLDSLSLSFADVQLVDRDASSATSPTPPEASWTWSGNSSMMDHFGSNTADPATFVSPDSAEGASSTVSAHNSIAKVGATEAIKTSDTDGQTLLPDIGDASLETSKSETAGEIDPHPLDLICVEALIVRKLDHTPPRGATAVHGQDFTGVELEAEAEASEEEDPGWYGGEEDGWGLGGADGPYLSDE